VPEVPPALPLLEGGGNGLPVLDGAYLCAPADLTPRAGTMLDTGEQRLRVLIANEKREFGAVAADRIGLVGVPRRSTWRRDE
jgi:hypothetical protein